MCNEQGYKKLKYVVTLNSDQCDPSIKLFFFSQRFHIPSLINGMLKFPHVSSPSQFTAIPWERPLSPLSHCTSPFITTSLSLSLRTSSAHPSKAWWQLQSAAASSWRLQEELSPPLVSETNSGLQGGLLHVINLTSVHTIFPSGAYLEV